LMTGFIDADLNPVSRMTIGALEDIGYRVSLGAADAFTLPDFLELAIRGIGAVVHPQGCMMDGHRGRGPEPQVLPESALLE
jgi:hypothetical protein